MEDPALLLPDLGSDVPFPRLDFISELEKVLKRPLPILTKSTAHEQMIELFKNHALAIPPNPSLPQLLDKLSASFFEPQCIQPTFIVHHPECRSPLSKSFGHPHLDGQRIAARAGFSAKGQELANMYEEENSPDEQRRKFEEQLHYRAETSAEGMDIDEQYLDALTWGLPSVGGWGCGIERLYDIDRDQPHRRCLELWDVEERRCQITIYVVSTKSTQHLRIFSGP